MQYHEKTIAVCAKGKYDDAPMREAIIALCKTLFHEVLGEEANMYYRKGKDGNIFTLSSSPYQFWIAPKKASKYKSIDTDRQERSELGQIASAIAWKKGFGSDDIRFKIIKNVHEELFGALSNDVAHVAASQDKSPLLDNTKLKRYESFVWEVLDHYKDDFHVNMSKLLSTSSNLNYDELKEKETNEELQMAQARSQLIHKLNEIIDADFRNPLVLIVPENVDPLLVKGLCRVPWNLIISFDSDRKRFFSIIEDEWKGKRPIRIDDVTCDGESETSFIFANGQGTADDKGGQIYKEWKKKYQSLVERALNKIRKGDSSITAICLTDPKDNPVFNKGGVGLLKENDELLIIGKIGSNLRKDLEENFDVNYDWGTTDDTHSGEYNLAMLEIVSVFNEINNSLKDKQESNAISDLTQEDIDRYKEVGIKIICPIPEETPKNTHHISEFYRGKTISENDLYNDYDVRRKIYEEFLENIKSYLKSDQRFIRYICQTPSCGATTFAMRLGYDIAVKNKKGYFGRVVVPVFISELKVNIGKLVENIKDLALKLPANNHLLAIVDRSVVRSSFEDLKERLTEKGACKISFVRLFESGKEKNTSPLRLSDELEQGEKTDFVKYFQQHSPQKEFGDAQYVIDFPLILDETKEKDLNIENYIEENVIKSIGDDKDKQDEVRQILSLIGFGSAYIVNTDNYVDVSLFDKLLGMSFSSWYQTKLERKERVAIERLIKFAEENGKKVGRVKTRFSKFNDFLIPCFGESLTNIAIRYIRLFFSQNNNEALRENYIYGLFFQKDIYENDKDDISCKKRGQFKQKLSLIFNKIDDFDSIKDIFDTLEEYIGDNSYFRRVKAQFMYNRAYFIDNEEHDSQVYKEARDILECLLSDSKDVEEKTDIYQSLGVLNFRQLGALRQAVKVEINGSIDDEIYGCARSYMEKAIEYCNAANGFDPCNTYALVTKAYAIRSFINLTKMYLKKDDYAFHEEEDYLDYTIDYENTVAKIARFVTDVKNTNRTSSQLELCEI